MLVCEYCLRDKHLVGCPNYTTPPIVEGIVAELEKEEGRLNRIKNEKEDVLSWLAECKFLDFDTRDKILSEYAEKIADSEHDIRGYKSRLEKCIEKRT